jgi:uncharacterized protein YbjT (DUF2867 family)
MDILVTGGTGHLGRAVASRLLLAGHRVRILARRPLQDGAIEWVTGDLATSEGIAAAVAGVDTVIHAATHSPAAQRGRFVLRDAVRSPADVDVAGTRALLRAASNAEVARFVYVSIVGLAHLRRMPYARRKLDAEQLVLEADVPWSIVRATGFYWLLDRMFANLVRGRVLAVPSRASMAPVDSDDFAAYIVAGVVDDASGERDDFAGPETLTMVELMETYLRAWSLSRRVRRAPLPRRVQAAITAGNTSAGARQGTRTWAEWLECQTVSTTGASGMRAGSNSSSSSAAAATRSR